MTKATDATIKPEDFGDVFDSWIAGATLSQKSIEIYGNPGLFSVYEQLTRELEVLKAQVEAQGDEASMADSVQADVEEKETELVELYEKWMASKSTWTVRAVPSEIALEMSEKYPDEKLPELAADADDAAKKAHKQAQAAYDKNVDGRNYEILEQCVMKVEFADGRTLEAELDDDEVRVKTPAIKAEQLAKLRKRLGQMQYIKLIGASKLASLEEPVIPAPFLRSSSKGDPT